MRTLSLWRSQRSTQVCSCVALLTLLILSTASTVLAGRLPKPSDKWIEVKTENFTLYSDDSERVTRNIGLNLERLRTTLAVLLNHMKVNSPVPTHIYVFKNNRSFQRYVDVGDSRSRGKVEGLFAGGALGNYVAINSAASSGRYEIVYHEYIHYYMKNNASASLPLWFNEGIAEYYTTFRAKENEVRIGFPVERHARALKSRRLIPLENLFTVTFRSEEYDEANKEGTFYAQSWALVHYLVSGEEERAGQLSRFLKSLENDNPVDQAFSEAFGVSYKEMEKQLAKYISRGYYPYRIYTLDHLSIEESVQVRRLDYPDVLFRLGDYLAHTDPERASDAREHFAKVLELKSDHAPTLAGMGFLLDREGQYGEAGDYYERSVAGDSKNAMTQYLRGTNLLRQYYEITKDGEDVPDKLPAEVEAARIHLWKSIELNPRFGPVFEDFDQTEKLAYGVFQRMLYGGKRKGAEIIERDVLRHARDRELARLSKEALLRETVNDAMKLHQNEQYEEALALIETVLEKTQDEDLKNQLETYARQTRETLEQGQFVKIYNRAVVHANSGEYQEAIKLLQEIVPKATNAELKQAAETLLQQLRDTVETYGDD